MCGIVGVLLTFTRFVPDGAGMSQVGTKSWYCRSVSRVVSLCLEAEQIRTILGTMIAMIGGDGSEL